MDEYIFSLALIRAIERFIGVLLGGLAIYLGYRLFMNIPQSTESSASADISGKVKIYLTRIGPGVFFALFGACIIFTSYYFQVTASDTDTINTGESTVLNDSGAVKQNSKTVVTKQKSYVGINSSANLNEDEASRQLLQVRQHIRMLNEVPSGGFSPQIMIEMEPALTAAKLALLQAVWKPAWGNFDEFQNWVNRGGGLPLPNPTFKEPYEVFNLKRP